MIIPVNSRAFVSTRPLVRKHVKISVDEWIMETTHPHNRVQIPEYHFFWKLSSISDLIVADLDTQSILSMVYKYPKILRMSGFVCGRVDFRSYSSTLRVPRNP